MIGETLGHYEIIEPLGKGGMGEVYRARDTNLDRDVAIKVLPEDFAEDAERLARFEREAKLLASLNHANIATIHGLEESDGVRFIAMEVVEGETLADRLAASGRIDVDDALDIARQIAEALEAAHESGVIHRDLKPANVKVTPDEKVKVLDFGLAKAFEADGSPSEISPDLSHSPTMAAATRTGMILGTAAYMSPEQARGKPVDKRTDVWAFGCVLFEMLSDRRAFEGETATDIIAAVVKQEPIWDALPAGLNPSVHHLLRRCLHKDPQQRLRDMGEARIVLAEDVTDALGDESRAVVSRTTNWIVGVIAMVAVVLLSFLGGTLYRNRPDTSAHSPWHLPLALGERVEFRGGGGRPSLALSPDGKLLAYTAEIDGKRQLFVQDLASPNEGRALPGTVEAMAPFFSPDGESIGFFQGTLLRRISVSGGEAENIAPVTDPVGGHWIDDGSVIFVPRFSGSVLRIDVTGEVSDLVVPRDGENFLYPQLLPGDEHVLLTVFGERNSVVVISISTGDRTLVATGGFYGRYVPTGHVLYVRGNELIAASLDLSTLTVGDAVVVADDVAADRGESSAHFAVAADGTLAYLEAAPGGRWLNRLRPGAESEKINTEPLSVDYGRISISPSGDSVAFSGEDDEVWIYDLVRHSIGTRLTVSPGFDWRPAWSADGKRIAFVSTRSGPSEFYEKAASGGGEARLLHRGVGRNMWPGNWLPDGETLVYYQENPGTSMDVMLLSPADDSVPVPFAATPFQEWTPLFSPDGRSIGYASDETGRFEVWVRSYPDNTYKRMVSVAGGQNPRFAEAGSIFYRRSDVVMRAELVDRAELRYSIPEEFVKGVDGGAWDVMPDGSSIIALEPRELPRLRLVLGAAALIEQR